MAKPFESYSRLDPKMEDSFLWLQNLHSHISSNCPTGNISKECDPLLEEETKLFLEYLPHFPPPRK